MITVICIFRLLLRYTFCNIFLTNAHLSSQIEIVFCNIWTSLVIHLFNDNYGENSIFIEMLLLSNNYGFNLLAHIVLYKLSVRLISKESTDGFLLAFDRLRDWNKGKYQYYWCVEMATLSWRQSAKLLKFILKHLVSILRRGIFLSSVLSAHCSVSTAHTISEGYYE